MAFKKINQILVFIILLFLSLAQVVQAGFGISPPYVQNSNLTRNSYYEQKIYLGRADADQELRIDVTIDVPGANEWISIDKGNSFILPKGEKQTAMIVKVSVPKDADFGTYKGNIKVKVVPVGRTREGQVNIVLGAQVDVDLDVLDKVIYDFKVWKTSVSDLEEGRKFWWLFFPGKIRFKAELENLGNIESGPTKISLDIYDNQRKKLLESIETQKIDKISPFATEEIFVEFPTKLPAGSYEAEFKIFKGSEIAKDGIVHLSILPYGTMPEYRGYGFEGLTVFEKATVILLILTVLIFLSYIGYKIYEFFKRRKKKKP
jgi:hypothetical protein